MSAPLTFTPRNPDFLDNVAYTQRVVDAILRNNPLTDAVVSEGLMKWIGNYLSGGGPDKINFLWIGEFFPADVNLPGSPPQKGFSLVRDDSRGGVYAFALYDHDPAGAGGLRQTIHLQSGDGDRLMSEARAGGQQWPETPGVLYPYGSSVLAWFAVTDNSPTWGVLYYGRVDIMGNELHYDIMTATTNGCAAEYRVHVTQGANDFASSTLVTPVNTTLQHTGSFSVAASRGSTAVITIEGRRTNGVGEARVTPLTVRCYTP